MLLRKILFGLSAFVLGISGAVSAQQKDASLLFHYRFDRDRNVELKGNAGLVDAVLWRWTVIQRTALHGRQFRR